MDQLVTVIGGTGRTGRSAVARLRELGVAVRVLGRHTDALHDHVEMVRGSITDADAVRAAVQGASGVIVVVESADTDGGPNSPEQVHFRGMQHVIAAAQAQGSHIVQVSQIYITRPERYPEVRNVIHWRGEAERTLRASGLPYTIVRPAWLTDAPAGQQAVRLEQGDTGEGEVSRADVAEACVQALREEAARGTSFEIYNVSDQPRASWHDRFAALTPDAVQAGAR